ncbi:hypothetical protein F4678DRAFT_416810 [Xylaria arbuscula]|nr:hypothetical protein F4678DRAFT_416810 [Xylaria arbuscula]
MCYHAASLTSEIFKMVASDAMSPSYNIQPDIFQELLTKRCEMNLKYKPADVKVFEISSPFGGSPAFVSFSVKANALEEWLTKGIRKGENRENLDKPKLRVVLGAYPVGHRGVYLAPGESRSVIGITPFTPADYSLIEKSFQLPKLTRLLLIGGVNAELRGHFQVDQLSRDKERPVFGLMLNLFDSLLIGIRASVSLSYDLSTGMINSFFVGGEASGKFGWLEDDLRHLASLATNPFLLPTVVCQRFNEAIGASLDRNYDELHDIETSSGLTRIGVAGPDGSSMRLGRCENPQLPVSILGVAQLAIATESYIKAHMLTVQSVKDELEAFPWHLLPGRERARAQEQNELIDKHLDWMTHTLKNALIRAEHLGKRAEVQITAINNLLAQRNNETNRIMAEASTSIAHDTKRDSSAMKSIAILTLVFLPATFTATYFSTPAVVLQEPSQSLYWAITLALTVGVVSIWLASFYGLIRVGLPSTKVFKSIL